MALRNMFGELALNDTVLLLNDTLRRLLHANTFPRDLQERQRVAVDSMPTVTATVLTGNSTSVLTAAAQQPVWFGSSSWNVVDGREEYRMISEQQFQITRQRWTIT